MRGKFITLEGIEGSGKTTQLEFIVRQIENAGKRVVCTREPGGTDVGEKIRDILLDSQLPSMNNMTELMLMFAARVEHVKKVIEPAINDGKWVVCDRFYDATYAYQGYGRGLAIDKIDSLKSFSINKLAPDKTFLLDVTLETSMERVTQRGNKDRFENEKISFYQKVRQGYLNIAKQNVGRVSLIDANQAIEEVQKEITQILNSLLSDNA